MTNSKLWIAINGNILLFSLVFGMAATTKFDKVRAQLHNRNAILTGMIGQFLILPLLGFLMIKTIGTKLDSSVGISLLVVTSSPGGAYSNW